MMTKLFLKRHHRVFTAWILVSTAMILGMLVAHASQPPQGAQSSLIADFLDLSHLSTFWGNLSNLDATIPLNITRENSTVLPSPLASEIQVNYSTLWYTSHFVDGHPVRIFARLYHPVLLFQDTKIPGVVMVHGLRSDSTDLMEKALKLASYNYTVLALDLPGHGGRSTGIPPFSAETSLNVTPTPRNSHFYHAAVSVYRAISVLATLPYVDSTRLVLVGGSFGGIMTFIVTALDPRVKAALPLLESGNFLHAFQQKMYTSRLVPEGTNFNDPVVRTFLQSFDPLIYAAHVHVPTFMIIGTHDPVTTRDDFNLTYSVIPAHVEKNILILPRAKHEMFPELDNDTIFWLEHVFREGPPLPTLVARLQGTYWTISGETQRIHVTLEGIGNDYQLVSLELGFKEHVMGFGWKSFVFTSDFLGMGELEGTLEGTLSITGFLLPTTEDVVIVARFSNGVVISSVLLRTRLFHSLTIPVVFTFNAVLFLAVIHFFQSDWPLIKRALLSERGKQRNSSIGVDLTERQQGMSLVLHYLLGGGLYGGYVACFTLFPWFAFPHSWVTWTLLEFMDVFVHQDLLVYLLLFFFACSLVFWYLKHDRLSGLLMMIPTLIVAVLLVMTSSILEEFQLAVAQPLSLALAVGMIFLPEIERTVSNHLMNQHA